MHYKYGFLGCLLYFLMRSISPKTIEDFDVLKRTLINRTMKTPNTPNTLSMTTTLRKIIASKTIWGLTLIGALEWARRTYNSRNKATWDVGFDLSEQVEYQFKRHWFREMFRLVPDYQGPLSTANSYLFTLDQIRVRAQNLPYCQKDQVLCIQESTGLQFFIFDFNVMRKEKRITMHGDLVQIKTVTPLKILGIPLFSRSKVRTIKKLYRISRSKSLNTGERMASLLSLVKHKVEPQDSLRYIHEAQKIGELLEGAYHQRNTVQ